MPYLQVDLDGMRKWPLVATGCGISEAHVYKGFLDLWELCWREKRATVGLLRLECLFGAMGRGERLVEVLIECEFIESTPEGYRVRGADKYLRITEARSRGGKKASANLKRGKSPGSSRKPAGKQPGKTSSSGPALTPIIEHHSPSIEQKASAPADAAPPVEGKRLKGLAEKLGEDVREILGRKYVHGGAKDTEALKKILGAGETDFEVRARFRAGLRTRDPKNWLCVRTIAQLGAKWNDLAGYGDPPPPDGPEDPPFVPPQHNSAYANEEIPF